MKQSIMVLVLFFALIVLSMPSAFSEIVHPYAGLKSVNSPSSALFQVLLKDITSLPEDISVPRANVEVPVEAHLEKKKNWNFFNFQIFA